MRRAWHQGGHAFVPGEPVLVAHSEQRGTVLGFARQTP